MKSKAFRSSRQGCLLIRSLKPGNTTSADNRFAKRWNRQEGHDNEGMLGSYLRSIYAT